MGTFASFTNHVRINPDDHPTWRARPHHALYAAELYGCGLDEDPFFDWRKDHWATNGHGVRIGHCVSILADVTIGNGAGAAFTKGVAPYSIVGGMPAREIRHRATNKQEFALVGGASRPRQSGQLTDGFRGLPVDASIKNYAPK